MQAQVSLRRLCRFLSSEDTDPSWITCITETQNVETVQHAVTSISGSYLSLHRSNEDMPEIAIMVENADFTWCHSQEIEASITLRDISLCILKGSLVAILGKARFPPFDFCLDYCSISMMGFLKLLVSFSNIWPPAFMMMVWSALSDRVLDRVIVCWHFHIGSHLISQCKQNILEISSFVL